MQDRNIVPLRRSDESSNKMTAVGSIVGGFAGNRKAFEARMQAIRDRRPKEEYTVPEPPKRNLRICPYCKGDTDGETIHGSLMDRSMPGRVVPCPVCSPPVLNVKRRRTVAKFIRALVVSYDFANEQNFPLETPSLSFTQFPKHGDQRAKKEVQKFVEGAYAEIILIGGAGRGKTGLAISAARELHRQGEQIVFLTMTDYIAMLQANFNKRGEDNNIRYIAEHVDILIVDDLGVERPSAFTQQEIQTLIDKRHKFGLRTLITTNYTLEGLLRYWHTANGEEAGFQQAERTISRLEGWYKSVQFTGVDLRKGGRN